MARPYLLLALNIAVSLVIMYFVMFAMIDGWGDFFNNINMAYMAVMMAAPMGPLMLLTMSGMYPSRPLNLTLHAIFVLAFIAALRASISFSRMAGFSLDQTRLWPSSRRNATRFP